MSGSHKLYTQQRYLFMSLDPVHIGTGQSQLGRVDNTIIREPGTNLPKIPGTSLMGAARNYASMIYGKPEAAGQHKTLKGKNHENCPIIYTFGTYTETEGGQQGKISISDAQILLFPVNSIAGPLWVSTQEILEIAGFSIPDTVELSDESVFTSVNWEKKDTLNLGWLSLKAITGLKVTPPDAIKENNEWNSMANRLSIVSSKLFSQIVNSNLEVRTSVAINPETGAAEDKALFTYEAIPRTTWLFFDVVQDDYMSKFPPTEKQYRGEDNIGDPLGENWSSPIDVLNAGFKLIEYLGIGGMVTRGFGRMKNICSWEV
jgi:CRISPR-associated protein Cmr4